MHANNQGDVDLQKLMHGLDDQDDGPTGNENELKQRFDDFFTSESDEIEDDLNDDDDAASSDSDSESGLAGSSFDEVVKAKAAEKQIEKEAQGKQESPENIMFQTQKEDSSSERRNKYKRDKKQTSGEQPAKPDSSPKMATSAFSENQKNDLIEFDPPKESQTVAQDFDDFFADAPQIQGTSSGQGNVLDFPDLGSEYDI